MNSMHSQEDNINAMMNPMFGTNGPMTEKTLYKADPDLVQSFQKVREQMHKMCHQAMNRRVRAETIDGQVFEGNLVQVNGSTLFLQMDAFRPYPYGPGPYPTPYPYPYNPYSNVILPLVLYDLLALTLLI